jgi:repressor LexA
MVQNIGEYLAKRRQDLGLMQNEVGSYVGVSEGTVSRWESGYIKNMKRNNIYKLAQILRISPLVLLNDTIPADQENDMPQAKNIIPFNAKRVPLVGRIAAGTPILAEQNIDGYENLADGVQADFCLQVQGDSMIGANIHSGDIVFIRQQEEVEDGEIAAVLIDDSATLKRFYRHDGAVELRPENPRYKSMIFTADNCQQFRVLGKAVALQTLIK